jgi:hypothetical protein
MSFIEMEGGDLMITQRAEYSYTADPENYLLGNAVMIISAIERLGQSAVPLGIFRKIRIQKVYGNRVAALSAYIIAPGPKMNNPAFDLHLSSCRLLFEQFFKGPGGRLFPLPPVGLQPLSKITLAVEKRDCNHRHPEVRCRTDRVPGKDPQPPAVCAYSLVNADLHGKIGYSASSLVGQFHIILLNRLNVVRGLTLPVFGNGHFRPAGKRS